MPGHAKCQCGAAAWPASCQALVGRLGGRTPKGCMALVAGPCQVSVRSRVARQSGAICPRGTPAWPVVWPVGHRLGERFYPRWRVAVGGPRRPHAPHPSQVIGASGGIRKGEKRGRSVSAPLADCQAWRSTQKGAPAGAWTAAAVHRTYVGHREGRQELGPGAWRAFHYQGLWDSGQSQVGAPGTGTHGGARAPVRTQPGWGGVVGLGGGSTDAGRGASCTGALCVQRRARRAVALRALPRQAPRRAERGDKAQKAGPWDAPRRTGHAPSALTTQAPLRARAMAPGHPHRQRIGL